MNNDDFFDVPEQEINLEDLQGKLAVITKKCNRLTRKRENWEETEMFKAVVKTIGEYAPIQFIETLVKYYQRKLDRFKSDDLLSLMDEANIQDITLIDGTKLKVTDKISTTTKGTNREKLLEWLSSIDEGDAIKETLAFPKGELKDAIFTYLDEHGLTYARDSKVEAQTLKRIVRQQQEAGTLPENIDEMVKISTFRYVDIK